MLVEAKGNIDGMTEAYEKEMRVYASEAVAASYGIAEKQMGVTIKEDSPDSS